MFSSARKSDISYYDQIKEGCLSIATPAPGSVVVVVVEGHGHLCTNTYFLHDRFFKKFEIKIWEILKGLWKHYMQQNAILRLRFP